MKTNKEKGRIGLALAISYFTLQGYTISLPLNDTQWYDLIVEKDKKFFTVQCKCTETDENVIPLRSCGGTNGAAYDNVLNHDELDFLFCVDKNLNTWLIPVAKIKESGITENIRLRTELSSMSHPKFDTIPYRVQASNKE